MAIPGLGLGLGLGVGLGLGLALGLGLGLALGLGLGLGSGLLHSCMCAARSNEAAERCGAPRLSWSYRAVKLRMKSAARPRTRAPASIPR